MITTVSHGPKIYLAKLEEADLNIINQHMFTEKLQKKIWNKGAGGGGVGMSTTILTFSWNSNLKGQVHQQSGFFVFYLQPCDNMTIDQLPNVYLILSPLPWPSEDPVCQELNI